MIGHSATNSALVGYPPVWPAMFASVRSMQVTTEAARQAAGRAITDRLNELAMSQTELARKAGLADRTVRELRTGAPRRHSPKTLALIERGLDWPRGTLSTLLGEPEAPTVRAEDADQVIDIIRGMIAGLDPAHAIALLGSLAEEIDAQRGVPRKPTRRRQARGG